MAAGRKNIELHVVASLLLHLSSPHTHPHTHIQLPEGYDGVQGPAWYPCNVRTGRENRIQASTTSKSSKTEQRRDHQSTCFEHWRSVSVKGHRREGIGEKAVLCSARSSPRTFLILFSYSEICLYPGPSVVVDSGYRAPLP